MYLQIIFFTQVAQQTATWMLRVLVSFGMSTTDHRRNMPCDTGRAKSTTGTGNFNLQSCQLRKISPLSNQLHIFVTDESNEGVYSPPCTHPPELRLCHWSRSYFTMFSVCPSLTKRGYCRMCSVCPSLTKRLLQNVLSMPIINKEVNAERAQYAHH